MNDFSTELTSILDDAAAMIDPHPDFEAARSSSMSLGSNGRSGRRRFPRALGIAAVSIALLGGGVAAFEMADKEPDSVVTSSGVTEAVDETAPKPTLPTGESGAGDVVVVPLAEIRDGSDDGKPPIGSQTHFVRSTHLGAADLAQDPMLQEMYGQAAPGETIKAVTEFGAASAVANSQATWELALELNDVPVGAAVPIRVSFSDSPYVYEFVIERPGTPADEPDPVEEPDPVVVPDPVEDPPPAEEPPPIDEPESIAFTVNLGSAYNDDVYMKQGFYGSAPAGSAISIASVWGSVHTTAGSKGGWEARLKLAEVPDGAVVHVRVLSNTSDRVFEYELVRDRPEPEPDPKPFTVNLGGSDLGGSPMKQGFYGTGTPGSAVLASSEFGAADAVVGAEGHWELWLKMYEVPGGTTVGVLVTNSASEAAHDFGLRRPEPEPEPDLIDFTANAALVVSDSNPLVNEYWGTSTAGAVVTISSPYGGGQVTSNGDGFWDARIVFSSAPVGEPFTVTVKSSKGEAVYNFSFTNLAPT